MQPFFKSVFFIYLLNQIYYISSNDRCPRGSRSSKSGGVGESGVGHKGQRSTKPKLAECPFLDVLPSIIICLFCYVNISREHDNDDLYEFYPNLPISNFYFKNNDINKVI